jgi:AcrR family transcriptional regulator
VTTTDQRKATAERNVQAILDAAERLLQRRAPANIASVAAEAGVSRVTVYAHFPTWEALLEAVVERAARRTTDIMTAATPERGTPVAAMERMLAAGWEELARYSGIAEAALTILPAEAVTRAHHAAHAQLGELLERGRADGSFRDDLPAEWLVTACLALIHACLGEVYAGRLPADTAGNVVTTTIMSLLSATGTDIQGCDPRRHGTPRS